MPLQSCVWSVCLQAPHSKVFHAVLHKPVWVKEAKLTQPMVNLFYVGAVLICSFLNPNLGCVVWHDEFPCVCSTLGISLVSQSCPSTGLLLQDPMRFPGTPLLDQSTPALQSLVHASLLSWGPRLPCLMLLHKFIQMPPLMGKKSQPLRQHVIYPSSWTDGKNVHLTPANKAIWEGEGQLRAPLPRMVSVSRICRGWFHIRSRNSRLIPCANPLQVTPPRPHSRSNAETQRVCVCKWLQLD